MKYLIDTDQVINLFHKIPETLEKFKEIWPAGVAISVITAAELYYGAYKSKASRHELVRVERFLQDTEVNVIGMSGELDKCYGRLQADLSGRGLKGDGFDVLIAATALVHGLALYTGNKKHFEHIKGLKLV